MKWRVTCVQRERVMNIHDDIGKNKHRVADLGSWQWIPENGDEMFWSPQAFQIFGYRLGECKPSLNALLKHVHPDDKVFVEYSIRKAINKKQSLEFEYQLYVSDNITTVLLQHIEPYFDVINKKIVLSGTVQNITEQKRSEEQIKYMAYYDTLTGLPNRRYFKEQVSQHIECAKRYRNKMAMVFLDLDNFKKINDSLGHSMGDLLLKEVADKLQKTVRASDIIARDSILKHNMLVSRFGGDEFTLLLSNIDKDFAAAIVAKRILNDFSKPIMLAQHEVYVTPSIGISVYPEDGLDAETLLQHSDTAMYHSKNKGRNNFQVYSESMSSNMLENFPISRLKNIDSMKN